MYNFRQTDVGDFFGLGGQNFAFMPFYIL